MTLARCTFRPSSLLAFGLRAFLCALPILFTGCSSQPSKPTQAETKPAEPAVPDEIQDLAKSLLGREAQVLAFGDLAKTGKQQALIANVIPKTPQNTIPGIVITRAVIAEKNGGQWAEIFRCDEHLKNTDGFLALTPLQSITGWRLQYEQNPEKGLQMYFTPVKGDTDSHVLPIGVEWNPKMQRYQSLDRSYEHFLNESPQLQHARSSLR
ncbi:MAG: hypothetical protein C5B56_09135 [Proteobacteria bacterium]|nr:MAG: hypothetical protein C5B56_09135 [Pseudomonadota bacterium]